MIRISGSGTLSQSRVSRLVADLEARGLVERSRAETDARGVSVSITDEGVEAFRGAQETHLSDLQELLFSRLSEPQVRQLAGIDPGGSGEDGSRRRHARGRLTW